MNAIARPVRQSTVSELPAINMKAGQPVSKMESCNQVENVDVNVQMLQSADARNEMRLAASSTGVSPYDIVFGSDAFIGELASLGWLMPLNDLIAEYSDAYDLRDITTSCTPRPRFATTGTASR